jgi:hypothetical protein
VTFSLDPPNEPFIRETPIDEMVAPEPAPRATRLRIDADIR